MERLVSKDIRHKNTEKPATHRYCVIVHKQESIYNTEHKQERHSNNHKITETFTFHSQL